MHRFLRHFLFAAAVVCGVLLLARAWLGPLSFLHSPLNAAGGVAVAWTLLLLQSSSKEALPSGPQSGFLLPALLLVTITIALFWRALSFPLVSDDYVLLRHAESFHWSIFSTAGGDGFYRPLGYLSLAIDSRWVSNYLRLWHLSALALHLLNVLMVFLLAGFWRMSRIAAFVAAALFAIHGSRPEAVVWIAARFDLLATFFVLAGLQAFLASTKSAGRDRLLLTVLAVTCMIFAMLTKETGYAFPLLVLLSLILMRERIAQSGIFFAIAALLFVYRWTRLSGIGGYGDSLQLLPALKALAFRLWAVLFFPINWSGEPGPLVSLGLTIFVVLLLVFSTAPTRRTPLLWAIGFTLLTAMPAVTQLLIGSDLQRSRLLYLPSAGFCLVLGFALEATPNRTLQWAAAAGVLVFSALTLEHNLNVWGRVAQTADRTCHVALDSLGPDGTKLEVSGLPRSIDGVYFFANGFPECVSRAAGRHVDVVMDSPSVGAGAVHLIWNATTQKLEKR